MIIKPKIRGFICTNAHPLGCKANVNRQIDFVKARRGTMANPPQKVLIIGASTGYGLASRITAAFASGAGTLGLFFEKPPSLKRTATAGYYNSAAFEAAAHAAGLYAKSLNVDAFAQESKQRVIDILRTDMGKVDLVVYSLASPRRRDPVTGEIYDSVLKPIGGAYTAKNLNTDTKTIDELCVEPASDKEIADTVKVMGGEDWQWWIDALADADLLAPGCKTVAYTYLGEELTWPIYGHATIGRAKEDLDRVAAQLRSKLADIKGSANVCVLKAVVTQASSAIPIMPLYLSILFKVMKAAGNHEGCIEQLYRLFAECLYHPPAHSPRIDDHRRLRVDNFELDPRIQAEVAAIWPRVTTDNLAELTDFAGYQQEFLQLFGFGLQGVDYDADVSPLVEADFSD